MKWRTATVLAVAALALAACGADFSSTSSVVVTTATSSEGVESEPSSNINDFAAKTVSGESFVLSTALAQKPVVMWFWAPG